MKGKRLIAVVLAMTVALGSVCWKPPKAKAVVLESSAALGAAATVCVVDYSTAAVLFSGMKVGAAQSAVVSLMGEYAAATGVATSGAALASSIATGILVTGGVLLVGAAAAALIGGFIDWLQIEKGLEAGGSPVVFQDSDALLLSNGTYVFLSNNVPLNYTGWNYISTPNGTLFPIGEDVNFASGASILFTLVADNQYSIAIKSSSGTNLWTSSSWSGNGCIALYEHSSYGLCVAVCDSFPALSTTVQWFLNRSNKSVSSLSSVESQSFSLDPKLEFQEIPQEIPEGQVLKIDTGIESLSADDSQAAADAIMQTAIDGALAPTVEVVADPNAETDPDTGTETDPDSSTETAPDTDSSILDWLKKIWESICNIPSAIAEAISSIFVPAPDFYPTAISNLKDAFSDRMGLLTYPISVLFDFLDRVVNLSDQQPILTWGNIYLPGYATPLVAAGQYNLNDAIGTSQGKQLHDIYLVIVDAIMILAFVDLCRHKYQKIIHN